MDPVGFANSNEDDDADIGDEDDDDLTTFSAHVASSPSRNSSIASLLSSRAKLLHSCTRLTSMLWMFHVAILEPDIPCAYQCSHHKSLHLIPINQLGKAEIRNFGIKVFL